MGMTAMAMHNQSAPALNESSAADLFALSDEQILEIAPEKEVASGAWPLDSARSERVASADSATAANQALPPPQSKGATSASVVGETEPPAWLAAQMKDAWGGEEAREFWDGVQQARSEAAAYRAAFATPEDARALKELYPGGVSEARAVAERARLLDEVDRAYFGATGNSPEQLSASRAPHAARRSRGVPRNGGSGHKTSAGSRSGAGADNEEPGISVFGFAREHFRRRQRCLPCSDTASSRA